jgi:hypothetical protein
MLPPVDNKFAAYGGSDFSIDTELKGEVVHSEGVDLYISPYSNYYHLLIEGNRRRPVFNENCGLETKPETQCGWVWYRDHIIAWILKAEKAGLDTMDPDYRMQLYAINNQLKILQAEITNLQLQASALGCP